MKQFKLIPFMRSKSIFRTMKSVAITFSTSVGQPVMCASVCGSDRYDALKKRQILQCRNCKHQTSLIAGTLMHRTRTPLRYWFWGIYYVAACNGETTAQQLSEKIGLNYYTARRMLGKIHEIEKNQGFMGDLLKSFKMPEGSREEISTGPGMETPPRPIKEQTISDQKKPEIPGYSLEEVIFESSRTWLWRGRRQSDGLLVLIKGAASPQQSAQELAEMRHEHEITQALEIDGVLRSEELVRGENGWALILENTEGLPLRKQLFSRIYGSILVQEDHPLYETRLF